jgi:hypothetical protein
MEYRRRLEAWIQQSARAGCTVNGSTVSWYTSRLRPAATALAAAALVCAAASWVVFTTGWLSRVLAVLLVLVAGLNSVQAARRCVRVVPTVRLDPAGVAVSGQTIPWPHIRATLLTDADTLLIDLADGCGDDLHISLPRRHLAVIRDAIEFVVDDSEPAPGAS